MRRKRPGAAVIHRCVHLVRRFLGALRPGGPDPADAAWAASRLLPGEAALFAEMPAHDRRHAIGVARRVDAALGVAPPAVLAAALLHDAGKIHARLGPFGRAAATIWIALRGRRRIAGASGAWARRCALYVAHPALGAAEIRSRGGREEAAAWAAVHHDESRWAEAGLDPAVVAALHAADDD